MYILTRTLIYRNVLTARVVGRKSYLPVKFPADDSGGSTYSISFIFIPADQLDGYRFCLCLNRLIATHCLHGRQLRDRCTC